MMVMQIIMILISVAFFTLMEQKVMSSAHIRKGPNKVGPHGMMQPFSDAGKLFSKEKKMLMKNKTPLMVAGAMMSLAIAMVMWSILGSKQAGVNINLVVLATLSVMGIGLYSLIFMGWGSNSKYTRWGSFRGLAQSISYEVVLIFIILSMLFLYQKTVFITEQKNTMITMMMMTWLFMYWGITILSETNRPPFDFSEGESELVSGFNTEYGSAPFAMIFMAEYAMMMGLSWISATLSGSKMTLMMVWIIGFVWIRTSLPRFRYEILMKMAWTFIAPMVILLLSVGAMN